MLEGTEEELEAEGSNSAANFHLGGDSEVVESRTVEVSVFGLSPRQNRIIGRQTWAGKNEFHRCHVLGI